MVVLVPVELILYSGRVFYYALMANRFIALDKCPGIRPIGNGECLHHIICSVVVLTISTDFDMLCGTDHLASSLKAGASACNDGVVHPAFW